MLRITPINLLCAGLLTHAVWKIYYNSGNLKFLVWTLLLLLVFILADQLFRVFLRDLRKIWLFELGFVAGIFLLRWGIYQIWT